MGQSARTGANVKGLLPARSPKGEGGGCDTGRELLSWVLHPLWAKGLPVTGRRSGRAKVLRV